MDGGYLISWQSTDPTESTNCSFFWGFFAGLIPLPLKFSRPDMRHLKQKAFFAPSAVLHLLNLHNTKNCSSVGSFCHGWYYCVTEYGWPRSCVPCISVTGKFDWPKWFISGKMFAMQMKFWIQSFRPFCYAADKEKWTSLYMTRKCIILMLVDNG